MFDNDLATTLGFLGGAASFGFLAGRWSAKFERQRPQEPEKPIEVEAPTAPPATNAAVWMRRLPQNAVYPKRRQEDGKPIICVANMKGGVGKTTIVANLAAHYAAQDKRVLLIDLDYQGSLTTSCLQAAGITKYAQSAQLLISTPSSENPFSRVDNLRPALPNVDLFSSYYDLATIETDRMVAWLTGAIPETRFDLSRVLASPQFQDEYDVAIIDAPPRFTTGSVNALCASTHLIVPTVLDNLSSEAAVYLARDIEQMRAHLFPHLKVVGIVPTLMRDDLIRPSEQTVANQLRENISRYWDNPDIVMTEGRVPRRAAFRDIAGKGIAYLLPGAEGQDAQMLFSRLSDLIEARL